MVSKKNQNQIFEVEKEKSIFLFFQHLNNFSQFEQIIQIASKGSLIGRKCSYFLDSNISDSHSTYAIFNIHQQYVHCPLLVFPQDFSLPIINSGLNLHAVSNLRFSDTRLVFYFFFIAELKEDVFNCKAGNRWLPRTNRNKKPTSDPKEWEKLESRKCRVLGS